jgi:hypothetical protein
MGRFGFQNGILVCALALQLTERRSPKVNPERASAEIEWSIFMEAN